MDCRPIDGMKFIIQPYLTALTCRSLRLIRHELNQMVRPNTPKKYSDHIKTIRMEITLLQFGMLSIKQESSSVRFNVETYPFEHADDDIRFRQVRSIFLKSNPNESIASSTKFNLHRNVYPSFIEQRQEKKGSDFPQIFGEQDQEIHFELK